MESSVEKLFTAQVRAAAASTFAARVEDLENLGDFENYVFGYVGEGEARVLRISHPSHRSAPQIEAELHWVEHLAANGVRMAKPVRSPRGRLTETVEIGEATFHVCAFERMPGRLPEEANWTPELFFRWGEFLGKCHAATVGYQPPSGTPLRHTWEEDPYIRDGKSWMPVEDQEFREQWDRTLEEMEQLPRDLESYGLCHTDLHQGNFHLFDGEIYGFDTDDCCSFWFIEDISSVFYYASTFPASGGDPQQFMEWAWPAFWRGYRREHSLDRDWLGRIHLFQRLRVLTLYALIHMKFEPGDPARESYLPGLKSRLTSGRPVLDVEFSVPKS